MTGAVLPVILAGPIVRRCTEQEITVWICTSTRLELGIAVYATLPARSGFATLAPAIGEGVALRCVRLGPRLFVTLLRAVPVKLPGKKQIAPFPTGALLAYDICKLKPGTQKRGASILADSLAVLSLTNEALFPTIVLQRPEETDLRVLFASCRKLHGPCDDAYPYVLTARYGNPYAPRPVRPNALLMMGDQIYADDVSRVLLEDRLQALSRELMGFQEALPGKRGGSLPADAYLPGKRQALLADAAGFTTTEGANHLARFGEFVAMYLLAWNGSSLLWPTPERMAERKRAAEALGRVTDRAGLVEGGTMDATALAMLEELRRLKQASAGSLILRKLMANTPTYMIFDDHDVTDDWNITPAWQKTVEDAGNPLGRRIVGNALASYVMFQGWGNDPDVIAGSTLLDAIEGRFATPATVTPEACDEQLLAFERWSFLAPTVPRSLFVDTRTRRGVAPAASEVVVEVVTMLTGEKVGRERDLALATLSPTKKGIGTKADTVAPVLMGPVVMGHLTELLEAAGAAIGERLILVTPSPVFDVPGLDAAKDRMVRYLGLVGKTVAEMDLEGWMTNKRSVLSLVKVLESSADLREVVLLSGDVHYAFNRTGSIVTDDRTLLVSLFNSSAIKNRPEGVARLGAEQLGGGTEQATRQALYLWEEVKGKRVLSCDAASFRTLQQLGRLRPPHDAASYRNLTLCEMQSSRMVLQRGTERPLLTTASNVGYLYIEQGWDAAARRTRDMVLSTLIVETSE